MEHNKPEINLDLFENTFKITILNIMNNLY